jgi:hypothetical protein
MKLISLQKLSTLELQLAELQEHVDLDSNQKRSDNVVDQEEQLKLISDLESQVDTLKKSEQLAWQKKKELEEELKNLKTLEDVRSAVIIIVILALKITRQVRLPCIIRTLSFKFDFAEKVLFPEWVVLLMYKLVQGRYPYSSSVFTKSFSLYLELTLWQLARAVVVANKL